MPTAKETIVAYVDELIREGSSVIATAHGSAIVQIVDARSFAKFRAGCKHLTQMLGSHAAAWSTAFENSHNYASVANHMLGTLEAIKTAVERDLLVTMRDLIVADTFADLLEQAEYLLSENYFVAAGVIGRAVLEEHLREWCTRRGLTAAKPRPTLVDYNTELYKAKVITKLEMQHVQSLVAVGNSAAHNEKTLKADDVRRFIPDVREFIVKHPLS